MRPPAEVLAEAAHKALPSPVWLSEQSGLHRPLTGERRRPEVRNQRDGMQVEQTGLHRLCSAATWWAGWRCSASSCSMQQMCRLSSDRVARNTSDCGLMGRITSGIAGAVEVPAAEDGADAAAAGQGRRDRPRAVQARLTAAISMENPYCSCKLSPGCSGERTGTGRRTSPAAGPSGTPPRTSTRCGTSSRCCCWCTSASACRTR